jgi:hypothetical protein
MEKAVDVDGRFAGWVRGKAWTRSKESDNWEAIAGEDKREVVTDETILAETEGREADEGCGGGKAYAKEGEGSSLSGASGGSHPMRSSLGT